MTIPKLGQRPDIKVSHLAAPAGTKFWSSNHWAASFHSTDQSTRLTEGRRTSVNNRPPLVCWEKQFQRLYNNGNSRHHCMQMKSESQHNLWLQAETASSWSKSARKHTRHQQTICYSKMSHNVSAYVKSLQIRTHQEFGTNDSAENDMCVDSVVVKGP